VIIVLRRRFGRVVHEERAGVAGGAMPALPIGKTVPSKENEMD
jgi:hypothetical protein